MADTAREPILLVDDETQFVVLLRSVLEQVLPTEHVDNPADALRVLHERRPTALVLDFRMPELSGADLLEKALQLHPGLPVVILSGHLDRQTAAHLLNAGARRLFLKPVKIVELRHQLLGLLGRTGAKPVARPAARPPWFAFDPISPAWSRFSREITAARGRRHPSVWIEGIPGALVEAVASALAPAGVATRGLPHDEDPPPPSATRDLLAIADAHQCTPAHQRQLLAWLDTLPPTHPAPALVLGSEEGLDDALASGRLEGEFYLRHSRALLTMPAPAEVREDLPSLARAEMLRLGGSAAAKALDDEAACVIADNTAEQGWKAMERLSLAALRLASEGNLTAAALAAVAQGDDDSPPGEFLAAVRLLAGDNLAEAAALLQIDPASLGAPTP